uniref:Uncharacterized protein n=1 Tax=Rhizophora mucronata TaxID=61149 RepID=A0A2P2PTE2_RHIMU
MHYNFSNMLFNPLNIFHKLSCTCILLTGISILNIS